MTTSTKALYVMESPTPHDIINAGRRRKIRCRRAEERVRRWERIQEYRRLEPNEVESMNDDLHYLRNQGWSL